jgi:DNA mismatch repair protein MutS2
MKATGLLQMMLQSGILIPVSPDSKFGIFKKLLVEIGDQQSLEDDLSTYSSHLQHMRDFLKEADSHTLLLIDEFGSGTDPRIGGALAEAMLQVFVQSKALGVITTHYGNLKAYAYKTEAVVNGAMIFDQQRMLPTYRLHLGRPGSSFAFEIARQSGLSDEVLDYAESRAGKHQRALEALLIELQEERDDLIGRNEALQRKEEQLNTLIKNYEALRNDLSMQKKRWRLEKKEDRLAEMNRMSNELKEAIREIRAAKDLEAAERKLHQLEEKKREIGQQAGELGHEIFREDMEAMDISAFKTGDHVRLRKSNATGTIERIDKQEALIHVGTIRMRVPLTELRPVGKPLQHETQAGINDKLLERKQHFNTTIDIRGLRPEEALKGLEQFFDEALMANVHDVKVIHGKGKGRLRRLVHQKLNEYPVKAKHHLAPEQGGEGVTVVEFE